VGPLSVVVFPPAFDDDLSLPQRVEELSVQQFVPEPGIKAFDVSILPWASWFDEGYFRTCRLNSGPDVLDNELWAIVTSDIGWRPPQNE